MFSLKSNYKPTGDQPKAIKALVESMRNKSRYQTLQGVTGSGKTFYHGKYHPAAPETNPYHRTQ